MKDHILTIQEAQEIVTKMCQKYGFRPAKFRWYSGNMQICNVETISYTKGFFWWKKEVSEEVYKPIVEQPTCEEAILELDKILKGPSGQGRVDLANKFRQKLGDFLLDEELKK